MWALPRGPKNHALIRCGGSLGPDFGVRGYRVEFDQYGGPASSNVWDKSVPSSVFWNLGGRQVSEIEVYSVCNEASVIAFNSVSSAIEDDTDDGMPGYIHTMDGCQTENTRLFGASIAGALMEEGVALHDAQIELDLAETRIRAAACSLEAIYGPDIAAGKPDQIVKLDVCRTPMTTLRSTLQVSLRRKGRRGDRLQPADLLQGVGRATHEEARQMVRARCPEKRSGDKSFRVVIAAGDRACFEDFVGMYFPDC